MLSKREIFIKLDNVNEIVEVLESIKEKEDSLRKLFMRYNELNSYEGRKFENWNNYLEGLSQKLEHISL